MALKVGSTTIKKVKVIKDGNTIDLKKLYVGSTLVFSAETVLFENGQVVPFTRTAEYKDGTYGCSIGTNIVFDNTNQWKSILTTNKIDLTNYSYIKFRAHINYNKNSNYFYGGLYTDYVATNYPKSITTGVFFPNTDGYVDYEINISGVSGSYYVGVSGVIGGIVTKIWLEE